MILVASAISMLSPVYGGKIQMTKNNRQVEKPMVNAAGEKLCIFKDETNSWCFDTDEPMLRIGWEWE